MIKSIILIIVTAQGPLDIQHNVSPTQFETIKDCDNYVRQQTMFGPESKSADGNIYYFEHSKTNIGSIIIPAGSKVLISCTETKLKDT